MMRFVNLVFLVGFSVLSMPASSMGASGQPVALRDTTLGEKLEAGIAHVEADRPDSALAPLRYVVDTDAAFVGDGHAPAAYWLGQAYKALGRRGSALDAWADGVEALYEADTFDVRLADTYIRHVFTEQAGLHYERASEAYLNLLYHLDTDLPDGERIPLERHVRALAPVLPPSMLQQVGLGEGMPSDSLRLTPDAGLQLVTWWRGQDTMPATDANERLEEHLERVVYAWRHYQHGDSLDDRGQIYIRLGPPYKTTTVDFNSSRFRNKVLFRNPTLSTSGFRDNEFWVYRRFEPSAHFLFIETEIGYYTIGTSHDLIPTMLEHGLSQSPRGERLSRAYVRTMAEAYRQLALYHEDFSHRYQELANYASLLDMRETFGQRAVMDRKPSTFARTMRTEIDVQDRHTKRRRQDQVPLSYTDVFTRIDSLPVAVRTARFLDDDGTTRTQVYWSTSAEALTPSDWMLERLREEKPPNDYYIAVSLAHQGADYRDRAVERHRVLVRDLAIDSGDTLEPRTYTVRGDTGLYHLALQWDAYEAKAPEEQDGAIQLGRRIKFNAAHRDSLTALRGRAGQLEMSDLKPLLVSEAELASDAGAAPEAQLEQAPPYPFMQITPDAPIALYFEVYHLTLNAQDRARYTVEYDVLRRTDRKGLASLFRGNDEQRIATRTTYEADSRTAREYIMLDLSTFEDPTGELTITIRIADETTGQQVERSIDFKVVAPPAKSEEQTRADNQR